MTHVPKWKSRPLVFLCVYLCVYKCCVSVRISAWMPCWSEVAVYHSLAALSKLGNMGDMDNSFPWPRSRPDLIWEVSLGQDTWLSLVRPWTQFPAEAFPLLLIW